MPVPKMLDDPAVVISRMFGVALELFDAKRLPDAPNAMPTGKPTDVANDDTVPLVSTFLILAPAEFATYR